MVPSMCAQLNVSSGKWTWAGLNTLCWAIGSISGSMQEEQENRFLVTVIRWVSKHVLRRANSIQQMQLVKSDPDELIASLAEFVCLCLFMRCVWQGSSQPV